MPGGSRAPYDRSACDYATLQVGDDVAELIFIGGELCAGCVLAGDAAGGAMFAVRHLAGLQIQADGAELQPAGPARCEAAPPPAFCGLLPVATALTGPPSVPPPRGACPARDILQVSLPVSPFPRAPAERAADALAGDASATYHTELRLAPRLRNAGTRAVPLRALRLELSFDCRVYAGPAASWLRRPPSEFAFTCWYGAATGPGATDGRNACEYANVTMIAPPDAEETFGAEGDTGAPATLVITFSAGWLCPGCTLAGGAGGVFGVWHHVVFMPLSPAGLVLTSAACLDADAAPDAPDAAATYDVVPAPLLPATPPAPQLPPLSGRAVQFAPLSAAFGAVLGWPADQKREVQTMQQQQQQQQQQQRPDGLLSVPPPATPPKLCPWWSPLNC
jgi:hypothetical protein